MKENGSKTRLKAKEHIHMQMELTTREIGLMTSKRDGVLSHGLMVLSMKEIILLARKRDKANSCLLMVAIMKDNSRIMR